MITSIVEEAHLSGAREGNYRTRWTATLYLSLTAGPRNQKQKIPNIPTPMYDMVYTMVTIMHALNVLSINGNNPQQKHIAFIKHLFKYAKHTKEVQ